MTVGMESRDTLNSASILSEVLQAWGITRKKIFSLHAMHGMSLMYP
jgi:hypothetical protein